MGCAPARYWHNWTGIPLVTSSPNLAKSGSGEESLSTQSTGLPLDRQEGNATEWRGRESSSSNLSWPWSLCFLWDHGPLLDPEQERGVDVGGITVQKAHCRYSHSERNVPNAWVPPLAYTPYCIRIPDSGDGKLGFAHDDTLFDAYSRKTMLHT